jgi:probable F420-dependent oxidoreductase
MGLGSVAVKRVGRTREGAQSIEFGLSLPSRGPLAQPKILLRLARKAEALGFSCVVVSDHVVLPTRTSSPYPYHPSGEMPGGAQQDYLEPLALMGFILASTRRIRVGPSVLVIPYRNPVVTAKQLAVLDVLSGGRVFVGCGTGWWPEEFEALQAPPFAERGAVTDEYIRLMVELWTKDAPAFDGKYYRLHDVVLLPKPAQRPHPPIWIGGHTTPALRRAGELGDAWHPIGLRPPAELAPDEYAAKARQVREHARRAGRDPGSVRLTLRAPLEISPSSRGLLRGPAAQVARDIGRYRRAGVSQLVFDVAGPDPETVAATMEHFAEKVWPAVAAR